MKMIDTKLTTLEVGITLITLHLTSHFRAQQGDGD